MKAFFITTFFWIGGFVLMTSAQAQNPDSTFASAQKLYENSDFDQAVEQFKIAGQKYLEIGNTDRWMESRIRVGDALLSSGNVREGLDSLLALNKETTSQTPVHLKARILNYIGWAYRQLEQYESSKEYYLEGLSLAESADDSVLVGRLNNNISYAYLYSGDYERAFSHQIKAKEIYETLGEDYRLSFVTNGIFLTLRNLGLSAQAEKYIRQSLQLRKEIGSPDLLDVAYHNMAVNYNDQGKTDSAIIYYQKSLELSRMLENPYDITQTLINIGQLYEQSGDYDNALSYYNEALENNYQTNRPVSITYNLLQLAEVAITNNDFENAESFYEEAQEWIGKANAPQTEAEFYLSYADMKIQQKKFDEALGSIKKAKAIADSINVSTLQLRALFLTGEVFTIKGAFYDGLAEYRRAYRISSKETISSKIQPAIRLARAFSLVQSDSAFIYANEAFALIDSIRTNVAGLSFRSGFFRPYASFYNEVASWYITQKNDPEKAFSLIEASKARVLMDDLALAQEDVIQNLDEATLVRKQQLAKKIDRLYDQLDRATTKQETQSIKDELKDLEFRYQSFLNEINADNKILDDFKYPNPVTLKDLQYLLDSKTAFLEYAFTESGLVRLVITKDDITGTYVDSIENTEPRTYLTNKIRTFRTAIIEGAEIQDLYQQGEALYQLLIPSFSSGKRPSISNYIIIPDGPLNFLPFEALSKNSRFLIEDVHVKYLPSGSIYSFIKPPHRETEFDLLAVAGSGFDNSSSSVSSTRSQASFASLPSTLLEVDSISVNFKKTKILKNQDVSEATLKSHDLSNFRYLHFATHANVNEINPNRSGLLLSKKTEEESLFGEDGHLNSREISGLQLNADLVTLSACNTGMGKVVTGEGVLGLQRSFLAAGASAVMVSLWAVFDRSTSVFMSSFYRNMLAHQQESYGLFNQTLDWFGLYEHPIIDYKTKAIRDAKLAMIEHPYYNHPVHWAPFVLIGK